MQNVTNVFAVLDDFFFYEHLPKPKRTQKMTNQSTNKQTKNPKRKQQENLNKKPPNNKIQYNSNSKTVFSDFKPLRWPGFKFYNSPKRLIMLLPHSHARSILY